MWLRGNANNVEDALMYQTTTPPPPFPVVQLEPSLTLPHAHRSNLSVTHRSRIHDDVGYAQEVTSTDPRQVCSIEHALSQLELLHGEVNVVAIWKFIVAGGNATTLVNSARGELMDGGSKDGWTHLQDQGVCVCVCVFFTHSYCNDVGDT